MAADFTYDGSKIVACNGTSGTPKTFADMHDADMAGTLELLVAWSPDNNTKVLGTQVQPAESKGLLVDFVVASKTTEADYIFVTGTDIDGNAQTESLDVSAGDGTYTTTKWFATITNIDCSDNVAGGGAVWADGAVQVVQNRWGVIWEIIADIQYKIDCHLDIGDGSTSTYITASDEQIVFPAHSPSVLTNATFALRQTTKLNFYSGGAGRALVAGGTLDCRNSILTYKHDDDYAHIYFNTGNLYLYDSIVRGQLLNAIRIESGMSALYLRDTYFQNIQYLGFDKVPDLCEGVYINPSYDGVFVANYVPDITITGISVTNYTRADCRVQNANAIIVDPIENISTPFIQTANRWIKEQYTCNIHIVDKGGNDLSGVTVRCVETGDAGAEVFSVATDAAGDIVEQIIDYKKWAGTSETLTDYSPHEFKFEKAGYLTYKIHNQTIDHPLVWEVKMFRSPYKEIVGVE